MFVGPPGSGKSTEAKEMITPGGFADFVYVNQDSQGKDGHVQNFREALRNGKNIIVDRMNFNKEQRARYLGPAKEMGYETEINVLHESQETCLIRAIARENHETIKNEENARNALHFFFKSYERVEDYEADKVIRHYPNVPKWGAIVCDLDGTLCNVDHRIHHVRREGKKNWMAFMDGIPNDPVNQWCREILQSLKNRYNIVLCSGRGEEQRPATEAWLTKHQIEYDELFMRQAKDSRKDSIVKEIILDFEILTRYNPHFMIDDRQQVVDMWRKRGYICLQCDKGDF